MRSTFAVLALAATFAQPALATLWPHQPDAYPASKVPQQSVGIGGNWDFQVESGAFLWTSTKSDRAAFGQYCNVNAGACAWVLVVREATCSEGEQHPVLVNT